MIKKKLFETAINTYIGKIDRLINRLSYRGDRCSDSQKLCLQQALNELEYNVTGLVDEDFKELEKENE